MDKDLTKPLEVMPHLEEADFTPLVDALNNGKQISIEISWRWINDKWERIYKKISHQ